MKSEKKITLDTKNTDVCIENLVISNPDTYSFLKDKENLEDWVTKAIIIGCVGLKQMILTENVDFVEKEFNKFIIKAKESFEKQTSDINDKIETTFSLNNTQSPLYHMKELIDTYFNKDKGQIKNIIDDTFNINNKRSALSLLIDELKKNSEMDDKKIQDLLNPNKTDSPARQLKEQILERINDIRDKEIKDIRDQVLKDAAVFLEKQKGTSKGVDFEEEVYETLESLACNYEDKINLIGGVTGTKSKKGDILIEMENKKRIIVECKDSMSYSVKKTMDEINEAIENRSASYGVFVFSKKEAMPKELAPIKITDKYIITYFDKDNLHISYRLARLFMLKDRDGSENSINFEKISVELNSIEETMRSIDNIQTKVSTIINSGEYVRENLRLLREGIDESIRKVKKVLGEKYDCESLDVQKEVILN